MKLGRNEPCHCGSGKKYKKCCQEKDDQLAISSVPQKKEKFVKGEIEGNDSLWEDFLGQSDHDWDYPDLSDEENGLIEKWRSVYDEMEDPDAIRKHIETFMSDHPELFRYLNINEDAVFDLGSKYRQAGRFGDYISFLMDFRTRYPDLYDEDEGLFNLDIICWLISTGNSQDISAYFAPYISDVSLNGDTLIDLVDLLIAKDISEPLLSLVRDIKNDLLQSDVFPEGDNILIPLIYDTLGKYLKEDYTAADVSKFVEEFAALNHLENTEELLLSWTARFKDTLRPFGRWEVDQNWTIQEREDFYFSIGDNFMRYLQEKFGISLICAQYHSNLINEYSFVYLDTINRKKWKNPFDFSEEMIDRSAMILSGGLFNMTDPVVCLSFFNAVYCFVDYLETCDMLDGIDPQAVKKTTLSLYEDTFPSLCISSSVTLCFDTFPFWKTV